jgi:hypothetical protein
MIQTWFLVLSLFFPRIAIFAAWFSSQLPFWAAPWLVKFIMAALIPRILILIYIATIMGICTWFWIHLVVLLLVACGSYSAKSRN